jgi:hypothetical protein
MPVCACGGATEWDTMGYRRMAGSGAEGRNGYTMLRHELKPGVDEFCNSCQRIDWFVNAVVGKQDTSENCICFRVEIRR